MWEHNQRTTHIAAVYGHDDKLSNANAGTDTNGSNESVCDAKAESPHPGL